LAKYDSDEYNTHGENVNINCIVNECTSILVNAADLSLKRKKKKKLNDNKNKNKWFDRELEDHRKYIRKLSRQISRKVPTKQEIENLRYESKKYKSACKRKYRQHRSNLIKELYKLKSRDSKEAWATLKQLKGESENSGKTNNISPSEWLEHYNNLNKMQEANKEMNTFYGQKLAALKSKNNSTYSDTLNSQIMPEEAIKALKKGKAPGEDLILNDILKSGSVVLINLLVKLFNNVSASENYPETWSEGIITSLFKAGCIDETNNYRGITITSCLGKLFNSILNNRLGNFIIENKLSCKEQIAYEKGARTTDHIFVLHSLTQKHFSKNEKFYACFVDMRKAFDTVLHNAILYKLYSANINGGFLN
jgi:hypothetical protein